MEDVNEPKGQEQTEINIGNDPVMLTAVDVVSKLTNQNKISLKAIGNAIPNAVAVANITVSYTHLTLPTILRV